MPFQRFCLLLTVFALQSACIAAPPSATDDARDTGDRRDVLEDDARRGSDAANDSGRYRDSGPGADDADTHDGSQPDAATPEPYKPLRRKSVAWIRDSAQADAVSADATHLALFLLVGLNLEVELVTPMALQTATTDLFLLDQSTEAGFDDAQLSGLAEVAKPAVVANSNLFNEMWLAAGTGSDTPGTIVTLTDHEIASHVGRVGPATIYTSSGSLQHRETRGAGAELVASDPAGNPTVFAFDVGVDVLPDEHVSRTAPARRVAFAPNNFARFTAEGWDLFAGAIYWSLREPRAPTLTCHIVTPAVTSLATMVLRARMRLRGCDVTVTPYPQAVGLSDLVVLMPDALDTAGTSGTTATIAAPVLLLWSDAVILADMHLIPDSAFATPRETASWSVRAGADERLRAALSGLVKVASAPQAYPTIDFADLPQSAHVVATAASHENSVTTWAVKRGAALADNGTAIAPRVAISAPQSTNTMPTQASLELFDGAMQWLLEQRR